jgi:excisionase family DNA binding protein
MVALQEITVQEAARRTRRSPETIRRWIWSGRLPATKRGNTYYVDVVYLDRIVVEMDAMAHSPGGPVPRGQASLGAWLAEVDEWKSGLAVAGSAPGGTASDLVIEDRHARR